MTLSGLSGYYAIYYLLAMMLIFLFRKKIQMSLRDTLVLLAIAALIGFVIPFSLQVIGVWWTILLTTLTLFLVAVAVIAARIKEDKQLVSQLEQVLKPKVSILPVREKEENVSAGATDQPVDDFVPEVIASDEPQLEPPIEVSLIDSQETNEEQQMISVVTELHEETAPQLNEWDALHTLAIVVEEEASLDGDRGIEEGTTIDHTLTKQDSPLSEQAIITLQELYMLAEENLKKHDYAAALTQLKTALSYNPPVTAKIMIVKDYVRILQEMGLYKQSIKQLEELLLSLPVSAHKMDMEIRYSINYMEIVMQLLENQRKNNLPWSLVSADIRQQASDQTAFLMENQDTYIHGDRKGA